ncbi:MAG: class I SAM-dependent methyltransferase, partial [Promethearchaeota archaeon]
MGNRRQEHKKEVFEFYIQHQRPEEFAGDPLLFYTKERVAEYARSKALMRIQEGITKRALKIVEIQPPARILDLGMGCGYASAYLQMQHYDTVGIDLNHDFLSFYSIPELNPIQADMRQFTFRPETFDMILSISAVQWILAEKNFELRKKYCTQLVQS